MTERIDDQPRDRDALLEDYDELIGYGVAHIDVAKRLDIGADELETWLVSRHDVEARRLRRGD